MTRPLSLNSYFFQSFSEVYIHNVHYIGSLSDRKSTFLEGRSHFGKKAACIQSNTDEEDGRTTWIVPKGGNAYVQPAWREQRLMGVRTRDGCPAGAELGTL